MKTKIKVLFSFSLIILGLLFVSGCKFGKTTIKNHEHEFTDGYVFDESGHYQVCACGEKSSKENHSLKEVVIKDSTCTSEGSKYYECTVCGYKSNTETVAKKDHTFGAWVSNEDATCLADGTKTRTCSVCSQKETVTDEGSKFADHQYGEWVSNNDATCLADGTKSRTCSSCQHTETVTDEGSKFADHQYGEWVSNNDATCLADGTKSRTCSSCQHTETVTDEGSMKEHTVVVDTKVDPTHVEAGLTEGSHCSVCNTVLVAQTVVNALGHDDFTGKAWETDNDTHYHTCSCGEIIGLGNHQYTITQEDGTKLYGRRVTTWPTDSSDGTVTYTCLTCAHSYTEAIKLYSVKDVKALSASDTVIIVRGIVISSVTTGSNTELILKDEATNDIIGVRDVGSTKVGTSNALLLGNAETPIAKGDLVQIVCTVKAVEKDGYLDNGKTYLNSYVESYGETWASTNVILGHDKSTKLDYSDTNIVTITNQDGLKAFFGKDVVASNCYKIIKLSGKFYGIQYTTSSQDKTTNWNRIFFDSTIASLDNQKINGWSPSFKDNCTSMATGKTAAMLLFGKDDISTKYGSKSTFTGDVYCILVGGNDSYASLVILNTEDVIYKSKIECDADNHYYLNAKGEKVEVEAHDFELTSSEAVTCTVDGKNVYTCKVCGKVKEEVVAHEGHKFSDWTQVSASTCTVKGSEERTCKCGEKETRELDLVAHTFVDDAEHHIAAVEANYSNPVGNIEYWICSVCGNYFIKNGDEYTQTTAEAVKVLYNHTHDYGEWINEVPAECEVEGTLGHYHCEECGKNFDTNKEELVSLVINAKGHNYGEWIAEVAAQCETEGTLGHYHCVDCEKNFDTNKEELDSLVINAKGHTYGELNPAVKATCDNDGIIAHYQCSACEKYFNENKEEISSVVDPRLTHSYKEFSSSLVTDASKLKAGDKIVLVYNKSKAFKVDSSSVDAAFKNNELRPTANIGVFELVEGNVTGTFGLKNSAGKYIGAYTKDAGGLGSGNSKMSETTSYTITIDSNGIATFTASGSNSAKYIVFDASTNAFRRMTSGTANVQIYLYDQGTAVANEKAATCTEDGGIDYYACEHWGKHYWNMAGVEVEESALTISKLGHDITATWKWADDFASATLTLVCAHDKSESHTNCKDKTIKAEMTSTATCTEAGTETYKVSYIFDGVTYEDTKTIDVPAGHKYSLVIADHYEENTEAFDAVKVYYTRTGASEEDYVYTKAEGITKFEDGTTYYVFVAKHTVYKVDDNCGCKLVYDSVNSKYVLNYKCLVCGEERSEDAELVSVDQAKAKAVDEDTIFVVRGIVIGAQYDGSRALLLIQDETTGNLYEIGGFKNGIIYDKDSSSFIDTFEYGDLVEIPVTKRKYVNNEICNNKAYLEAMLSSTNTDPADCIKSTGGVVKALKDSSSITTITTAAELEEFLTNTVESVKSFDGDMFYKVIKLSGVISFYKSVSSGKFNGMNVSLGNVDTYAKVNGVTVRFRVGNVLNILGEEVDQAVFGKGFADLTNPILFMGDIYCVVFNATGSYIQLSIISEADIVPDTVGSVVTEVSFTDPTKTIYKTSEDFSIAGATATVSYLKGARADQQFANTVIDDLSSYITSNGFVKGTAGKYKVVVTVEGKIKEYEVEVAAKSIESISAPTQTILYYNTLTTAGLVPKYMDGTLAKTIKFEITYDDESTEQIDLLASYISGTLIDGAGNELTITYGGKSVTWNVTLEPYIMTVSDMIEVNDKTSSFTMTGIYIGYTGGTSGSSTTGTGIILSDGEKLVLVKIATTLDATNKTVKIGDISLTLGNELKITNVKVNTIGKIIETVDTSVVSVTKTDGRTGTDWFNISENQYTSVSSNEELQSAINSDVTGSSKSTFKVIKVEANETNKLYLVKKGDTYKFCITFVPSDYEFYSNSSSTTKAVAFIPNAAGSIASTSYSTSKYYTGDAYLVYYYLGSASYPHAYFGVILQDYDLTRSS